MGKDKRKTIVRAQRKKEGLCVICGDLPPIEGQVGCKGCYERNAAYKKEMASDLKEMGFCIQCRAVVTDRSPATKKRYSRCQECRAYQNQRRYNYHLVKIAKKEEAHECVSCHRKVEKINHVTGKPFRRCLPCRIAMASHLKGLRQVA